MEQLLTMLGSIGFNWHIALANFVNFLIVFGVLHFLVFKKLAKTLEHRKSTIKKGLEDAEKGKHLLLNAESEKASILKDAEDKHLTIIEDAEKKALVLAEEINQEALKKGELLQAKLEEEHNNLRKRTEKEFNAEAPKLVAKLYEQLLKDTMTEADNNRFIGEITKN